MTHRKTFCKCARFFGVITVSAVISACAVQTQQTNVIPPLENQPHVEIETVDFLGLSKPMKQFIGTYASEDMNDRRKAWNLAYAALDPVLFDFDYDSSVTLTAADTFRLRTGNCLSFSMMFVALAREAGLNAWFQEVKIPPEWTSVNSTFLVSMHVNAVVQVGWLKYVVDVSRTKRGDSTRTRKISDAEAEAQYYNNLGADALVKNDLALAYSYLVKATRTAPDTSYTWSNLAVVFNRNGQSEDAKNTYFTALDINPVETSAMNNLQAIYLDEGDLVLADEFGSKVERHRRKNPYYLHYLSYQAIDEQRYENAIKLLNQAIKINKEEYRFHFTLARALILNGEKNPALKSFTQAKQLASPGGEFESFSFADLKNSTHF